MPYLRYRNGQWELYDDQTGQYVPIASISWGSEEDRRQTLALLAPYTGVRLAPDGQTYEFWNAKANIWEQRLDLSIGLVGQQEGEGGAPGGGGGGQQNLYDPSRPVGLDNPLRNTLTGEPDWDATLRAMEYEAERRGVTLIPLPQGQPRVVSEGGYDWGYNAQTGQYDLRLGRTPVLEAALIPLPAGQPQVKSQEGYDWQYNPQTGQYDILVGRVGAEAEPDIPLPAGEPRVRSEGGYDWQYNPQTGQYDVNIGRAGPGSVQELIARALDVGDWASALQLDDFTKRPSEMERLQAALDVAGSPADYMTVLMMMRGELPVQAQPGTFQRIAPESAAFGAFGFGPSAPPGAEGFPALAPPLAEGGLKMPPPELTGQAAVQWFMRNNPELMRDMLKAGLLQPEEPWSGGPFAAGLITPEQARARQEAWERAQLPWPQPGEPGGPEVPPGGGGAGTPPGPPEWPSEPGGPEVPPTWQPTFPAGPLSPLPPPTWQPTFPPGVQRLSALLPTDVPTTPLSRETGKRLPFGGWLSPNISRGRAMEILRKRMERLNQEIGAAQGRGEYPAELFSSLEALQQEFAQVTGSAQEQARQEAEAVRLAPPFRPGRVQPFGEASPNVVRALAPTIPTALPLAVRQVGLQGSYLAPSVRDYPSLGALKFPALSSWQNMLPTERSMFQRAVRLQGVPWEDYVEQWRRTWPGGFGGAVRRVGGR